MRNQIDALQIVEIDYIIRLNSVWYGSKTIGAGDGSTSLDTIGNIVDVNNVEDIQQSTPCITITINGILSDLYNKPCTIYQVLNGELVELFSGVVTTPIQYNEESNNMTFDVRVKDLDAKIGHIIQDSESVDYQDVLNNPFPIVFGTVFNYEPLKYTDGLGVTNERAISAFENPGEVIPLSNGTVLGEAGTEVQLQIATICVTGTLTAEGNLTLNKVNDFFYEGVEITYQGNVFYYAGNDKTFKGRCIKIGSTWSYCYDEIKTSTTTFYVNPIEIPLGVTTVSVAYSPDSTYTNGLWWYDIPQGSDVLLLDAGNPVAANKVKYIVSIGVSTIKSVKAEREYLKITKKQEIPSSYYTINTNDIIDGVSCTTIEIKQLLSTLNEGWSDEIYLTVTGRNGEITAVLSDLLTSYSDYTVAAQAPTSIYTNFVLQSNEQTLSTVRGLAAQCGIDLYIRDGNVNFFFNYKQPTTGVFTLTNDMIKNLSYSWSYSDEENLVTKLKTTWYNDITDRERYSLKLANDDLYGVKESEINIEIFKDAGIIDAITQWQVKKLGNIWKTISFSGFIETLALQPYDYIEMPAISNICDAGVFGLVQSVSLDLTTGLTNIVVWLPVKMNGMTLSSDAYTTLANSGRTVSSELRDYKVDLEPLESDRQKEEDRVRYQTYENRFTGTVVELPNSGSTIICNFVYEVTAWAAETQFSKYQTVTYSGETYICTENHKSEIGNPPSTGGSWRKVTTNRTIKTEREVACNVFGHTDVVLASPQLVKEMEIDCYVRFDEEAVFVPTYDFYVPAILESTNRFPVIVKSTDLSGTTVTVEYNSEPIAWVENQFYHKYDVVLYNTKIYICIKPHWSLPDTVGVDYLTYWIEFPTTLNCNVYDGTLATARPHLELDYELFAYLDNNEVLQAEMNFYTGGGGGDAAIYVKIIQGLSYDSESTPGRSTYLCRLTSDSTAAWASGSDYPLNHIVLGSNNRKYTCTTSAGSGTQNPVTDTENTNWTILEDEVPVRIWHGGNTAVDMRKFAPWLNPTYNYPVRLVGSEYYFELQFEYIGTPGQRSISVEPSTLRLIACVSDTVPTTGD